MFKQAAHWTRWGIIVLLGLVFALDLSAYWVAEGLWFQNLGYLAIFQTQVGMRILLWIGTLSATAAILWGNLYLTQYWRYVKPVSLPEGRSSRRGLLTLLLTVLGLGGLLACFLVYQGQLSAQFWHGQPTPVMRALPQFQAQTVGALIYEWIRSPWQLGLVALFLVALSVYPRWVLSVISLALCLSMGLILSSHWTTILLSLHPVPFQQTDPLFEQDISFYMFRLPLWELLRFWWVGVSLTSFVSVTLIYLLSGDSLSQGGFPGFSPLQKRHLYGLAGSFMMAISLGIWLDRYELLYSTRGIIYGASFTEATVALPANTILSLLGLGIALLLFWRTLAWRYFKLRVGLFSLLGLYVATVLIGTLLLPMIVQWVIVQPNELAREEPYIRQCIRLTRQGFDLAPIEAKTFNPQDDLTPERLQANNLTIRNIRLWDTQPLLEANRQLQRFRLYYEFPDADVDRYQISATPDATTATDRRQVLIAARELDYDSVPEEAQTWVNERFIYTHGYGFTISPVNTAAASGLPEYFVQDIGTTTDEGDLQTASPEIRASIPIRTPRLYFGELTHSHVITGTQVKELDYPSGNENVYNVYSGAGGVGVGAVWRRGLFALYLRDWRILLAQDILPEAKVLFRRQIQDRVSAVAPFLQYDHDPYLVAADPNPDATPENPSENTLFWIIDAYTTSDRYPYSDPGGQPFNYIRNSVKVVIDAYNGSMSFYAIEPEEPILQSWSQVFPDWLEPLDKMPPRLRNHIRYPLDLFKSQTQSLLTYHMVDPQVFYNREDPWRVPNEIYGEATQRVEPYYLIMKLPDEQTEEFILLSPFTPLRRNNLIGWLAARSDGENYGRRLLYQFPKQELVFGPEQIEALINQDPVISQQISLWNRQGSRVIQGNLLIIPIEQSLLYVEPLYLEADQTGVPILARVIVVYGDRIVMAPTLDQALNGVFAEEMADPSTIIRSIEDFDTVGVP
ncbi:hypothetical protein GS597_15780 [Synechococcales cyanobacterium C]|uniref:UPF0182 protein GS597_15780 n=1 Tax=Petrachloros mirabilis ULC683 TaxID=2781853 RepID=A0A8K2A8E8_9CYAN|nr:UPF0182 family protein [Petrachloros mirabilis]NCJ07941.1 hypothetical protein [Petrachloros mirabilis ULC683]